MRSLFCVVRCASLRRLVYGSNQSKYTFTSIIVVYDVCIKLQWQLLCGSCDGFGVAGVSYKMICGKSYLYGPQV